MPFPLRQKHSSLDAGSFYVPSSPTATSIGCLDESKLFTPKIHLMQLPDEVLYMILNKLSPADRVNCSYVSKSMHRIAKDPTFWRGLFWQRPSKGYEIPSCRLWSSSVQYNGKWYLYGGHTTNGSSNLISNVKNDFYEYDFKTQRWSLIHHTMQAKTEHKCIVAKNALWFVGGYNGCDYTNDVFRWDPLTGTSSLVETVGERFSARSALTVVLWKNKLVTFGGWNGFSKTWFNDLHEFNLDKREWKRIHPFGKIPSQRTSHAAVVYKNCMYIFGGFSGEIYLNDLQEYNFETNTWRDISNECWGKKPEPRSRFCATVHGDYMYILGGWNKLTYFADIYCFNFVTKCWSEISNPKYEVPSISQYSWSVYQDSLYIFGGYDAKKKDCVNDVWTFQLPQGDLMEE